jgi:hypothetical protein
MRKHVTSLLLSGTTDPCLWQKYLAYRTSWLRPKRPHANVSGYQRCEEEICMPLGVPSWGKVRGYLP